jgi:hypothetical protein
MQACLPGLCVFEEGVRREAEMQDEGEAGGRESGIAGAGLLRFRVLFS